MPDLVSMINYDSLTPIPALLCTVSTHATISTVKRSKYPGWLVDILRVHRGRHVPAHVVLYVCQLDLVRGGRYGPDSMAFQVS